MGTTTTADGVMCPRCISAREQLRSALLEERASVRHLAILLSLRLHATTRHAIVISANDPEPPEMALRAFFQRRRRVEPGSGSRPEPT